MRLLQGVRLDSVSEWPLVKRFQRHPVRGSLQCEALEMSL